MTQRRDSGLHANTDWFGVEVRHLAALAAVAHEGSFGGAARRLGYTQSAISGQIATLERIVGVRMLNRLRGARSVELTPEGRVLLRHAETISSQLAAARHDLGSLVQGKRESLRIGTFETFGPHFLAETLRSCADGHGAVPVEVHRAPDGTSLLRLLEEGAVDLALAALPLARPALASRVVVRDGFVLVTRVDDPIAATPYVELGALSGLRLICGDTVPSQATFEASLAATDVQLRVVMRHELGAPLQELVRAGVGFGLVPAVSVVPDGELAVVPLETAAPARTLAVAWHRERGLDLAAERFVAHAVEVGAAVESRMRAREVSVAEAASPPAPTARTHRNGRSAPARVSRSAAIRPT
ncbi:MAG: LysR family transcriptional regulator [Gaiellaceae bacterium]